MPLPGSNKRTLKVQSLMSPNVIYQVPNLQCQLGLLQPTSYLTHLQLQAEVVRILHLPITLPSPIPMNSQVLL